METYTFSLSSYKNRIQCLHGCKVIKETGRAKLVENTGANLRFWVPTEIFNRSMIVYPGNDYSLQMPIWFKLTLLDLNNKPKEA